MTDGPGFDAIVLAGGGARRLGGVDKPAQQVGGVSLLDRVLAAVGAAERVVVVGPRRSVGHQVVWAREEPPGSGPVAAIEAALPSVHAPRTVLLAADLPDVGPAVPLLLAALDGGDAAVLCGGDAAVPDGADAAVLAGAGGRRNVLAAAWRTAALRAAVQRLGGSAGKPVRALYAGVDTAVVPDPAGWGADCDTWDDLDAARRRAAEPTERTAT